MTGLLTFIAIFAAIIFLTNKSPDIQRLKRDKTYLNLILILIAAGFIFNLFGSLMMFLFSICMPLSCKLHSIIVNYLCMKWKFDLFFTQVIFLHASLRTRNLKNKVANKIETIGISRTPMGFFLELLGATNEIASWKELEKNN